jgi:hypothetical protein
MEMNAKHHAEMIKTVWPMKDAFAARVGLCVALIASVV